MRTFIGRRDTRDVQRSASKGRLNDNGKMGFDRDISTHDIVLQYSDPREGEATKKTQVASVTSSMRLTPARVLFVSRCCPLLQHPHRVGDTRRFDEALEISTIYTPMNHISALVWGWGKMTARPRGPTNRAARWWQTSERLVGVSSGALHRAGGSRPSEVFKTDTGGSSWTRKTPGWSSGSRSSFSPV